MGSIKKECGVYTSLWILYYLQGVLYANASLFAKFLLVAIISMSIYRLFFVFSKGMNPYLKALFMLLVLYIVYGILHLFGDAAIMQAETGSYAVTKFYYLKDSLLSILPIFSYYFYCKENAINENNINKYVLCFLGVAILNFFSYSRMLFEQSLLNFDSALEIVNNMGYRFVPLIPLVYFLKKYRMLYIFICFVFIILGLKRGAIVVGSLFVLLYFYRSIFSHAVKGKSSNFSKISAILLLGAALFFVNYYMQQNEVLFKRLNSTLEGDYSGREDYVVIANDYLLNKIDFIKLLVGGGANTSIRVIGNYAHNDWYEIAMNNGLLGLLLYVNFLIVGFKTWRRIRKNGNSESANSFEKYLLSFFMMSFFSMAITGMGPIYGLGVGYCLSKGLTKRQYK